MTAVSEKKTQAWKWLVGLFFLLILFDGALRKWVLPSQSLVLFVLKDIVLWGAYLMYALKRDPFALPRPLQKTWIPVLLGGYVFVVLLQAFNLRQPALIVSALGLKYHLAFLPLVVLVPAVISDASEQKFTRLLWGYSIFVCLPILALGIYQFFQPPSAWINQYIGETEHIAAVAGNPRITSTFSYIGSFTPYLEFSTFLGTSALLAGFRWNRTEIKILGAGLTAAIAIVLPMTGSRSVVAVPVIALAVLFLVMRERGNWIRLITVVVLSVFIVGSFGSGWALQGWSALGERVDRVGTEEAEGRFVNVLTNPIAGVEEAGLFGYGVGTNAKPATRLTSQSDWEGRYSGDRGGLRVVMELGILGWMVLMALKLALLYTAFLTVRASASPLEFIVSAVAFCVLLSNLVLTVVFNVVDNALYWGSAGAVIGIWARQQVRRYAVRKQEMSTTR